MTATQAGNPTVDEGGMGEKTHFRATAGLFALALALAIGGAGLSLALLQSLLVLAALAMTACSRLTTRRRC